MFDDLNDNNFMLYAAKVYDKPNAVMSEFEEDINRILYIKRLLTKYDTSGVLKERLILNHLVILYNVFGVEAATRILFFKLDEEDYKILKPFLMFLNFLPKIVYGIKGRNIITNDIKLDTGAIECLRNLR
jgi:hypothetical protein